MVDLREEPGFMTVGRVVSRALAEGGRAAAVRAYRLYRGEYGWIHTAWDLERLATRLDRDGQHSHADLVRRLLRISYRCCSEVDKC